MRKRSCAVSYYTLFQLECAGIKLIILSFLRDQLIMAAALDNPSMLENHDHIGIPNCGQPVHMAHPAGDSFPAIFTIKLQS